MANGTYFPDYFPDNYLGYYWPETSLSANEGDATVNAVGVSATFSTGIITCFGAATNTLSGTSVPAVCGLGTVVATAAVALSGSGSLVLPGILQTVGDANISSLGVSSPTVRGSTQQIGDANVAALGVESNVLLGVVSATSYTLDASVDLDGCFTEVVLGDISITISAAVKTSIDSSASQKVIRRAVPVNYRVVLDGFSVETTLGQIRISATSSVRNIKLIQPKPQKISIKAPAINLAKSPIHIAHPVKEAIHLVTNDSYKPIRLIRGKPINLTRESIYMLQPPEKINLIQPSISLVQIL